MRRVRASLVAGVLLIGVLASGQTRPQPQPSDASPLGLIPPSLVSELVALGVQTATPRLLGIPKLEGKSLAVLVMSNRALIVSDSARATEKGARFTPPDSLRRDAVVIACGDADLGEIFECSFVRVTDPTGARIAAASYDAGPRSYHNALGASWTVRRVVATYAAAALASGFMIAYGSPDGVEWTMAVSMSDAANRLLLALRVGDRLPIQLTQGPPPSQLRVRVDLDPSGWRITNLSSYTWETCSVQIGGSEAVIGPFAGDGTIFVTPTQFSPPVLGDRPASDVSVWCQANGTTYVGKNAP